MNSNKRPKNDAPVTPLSPEELESNFSEINPPLTKDQAILEASRCLYCYDAPCTRACPTGIDVPKFIRQILHQNPAGAAETIYSENILGGACARACPTEVLCEGACVDRTLLQAPVQIGRLQRYATDHAAERGLRFFEPGPETGKRVAIIGAGPAGLACACELRKAGHAVTIFEARDVPGGLNTLGIATYKITTEFALKELEPVLEMGIDLRLNTPVDASQIQQFMADYDAVFLGVGLGAATRLQLPGENLAGVWDALDFIFQTHNQPLDQCRVGKNVIVLGAGNTAIDAATAAARLGAEKVTIVYRRTAAEMSAYSYEFELAKSDGIAFEWKAEPIAFHGEEGRVGRVLFRRTQLPEAATAEGLAPSTIEDFSIPCDMVIKALGQKLLIDLISAVPGLRIEQGRIVIDPQTGSTGVPGLYAGGDCTSRGAEIVNAVQEGKIAAKSINQWVSSPAAKEVLA